MILTTELLQQITKRSPIGIPKTRDFSKNESHHHILTRRHSSSIWTCHHNSAIDFGLDNYDESVQVSYVRYGTEDSQFELYDEICKRTLRETEKVLDFLN